MVICPRVIALRPVHFVRVGGSNGLRLHRPSRAAAGRHATCASRQQIGSRQASSVPGHTTHSLAEHVAIPAIQRFALASSHAARDTSGSRRGGTRARGLTILLHAAATAHRRRCTFREHSGRPPPTAARDSFFLRHRSRAAGGLARSSPHSHGGKRGCDQKVAGEDGSEQGAPKCKLPRMSTGVIDEASGGAYHKRTPLRWRRDADRSIPFDSRVAGVCPWGAQSRGGGRGRVRRLPVKLTPHVVFLTSVLSPCARRLEEPYGERLLVPATPT